MDLIRNEPLYKQAANVLRQAIAAGEYPPGAPLPSEAALAARYKISRPTVRQAIASLRAEGLVDVVMGKGSFVRATTAGPISATERTVTRAGSSYNTPDCGWTAVEPPTVYRATIDAVTAALLGMGEGEEVLAVDRILMDEGTGFRRLQRVTIPLATAVGTNLADEPTLPVVKLYEALALAGYEPAWTESVQARMPNPDERTALRLPDAVPILLLHRVTFDAGTGLNLILEELRGSAEGLSPTYAITALSTAMPSP